MSTNTAKYLGAAAAVLFWFALQIINGAISRLALYGTNPFGSPLATASLSWALFSVVTAIGLFAGRRPFLALAIFAYTAILLLEVVEAVALAYTQPFFLSTVPQLALQLFLLYKLLTRKVRNEFASQNA